MHHLAPQIFEKVTLEKYLSYYLNTIKLFLNKRKFNSVKTDNAV